MAAAMATQAAAVEQNTSAALSVIPRETEEQNSALRGRKNLCKRKKTDLVIEVSHRRL